MNYPNIFIEYDFWGEFENLRSSLNNCDEFDRDIQNRKNSFERILQLFRSANIYTNEKIQYSEYKEYIAIHQNWKSVIFREIVKSNGFKSCRKLSDATDENQEDILNQSDTCFFTTENHNTTRQKMLQEGRIYETSKSFENDFFLNTSCPSEPIPSSSEIFQDFSKIEKITHPCNSLIILDRYFLSNFNKKNQKTKKSILSFLNKIISPKIEKYFELDIIFENPNNNALVTKLYHEILNEFDNKLSLHIYFPYGWEANKADRYMLTNYSVITIGHPFDRESFISSNFFPSKQNSQDVINAYNYLKERIGFVKKIIEGTNEHTNDIVLKLKSDNFSHRIFN